MLNLHSMLLPFGFDPTKPTKLVRHQDRRFDIEQLYRADQFEFYQSIQRRPVFRAGDQIVSFLGRPGTHAVFVGVYDVLGVEEPLDRALPDGFLFPNMNTVNLYLYELRLNERFTDLRDRLVIDWGAGTRTWVQQYGQGEKPVVEVLPQGYVRQFPGFMDVVLSYDELVKIINNPVPHRDWHRMLGSVAGVYLILDTKTGNQYVGSAYGARGLLGRWQTYANTVHGGNQQLQALVESRPDVARDLQFAILQTLPLTLTAREVVAYEVLHKQKLGTRAHGLNDN
ncbi:GIY-YIG nuclease family protein [Immundisolibacter cernigliae]|uniref:GIY-YIG domain-containing protein n=1 Tax=Immundisolibacter cernigliae TaxID=1810504 RepID=A0A1B1YWF3_9GAMM|nr:GIY-YIG nuclease family protein [Immundisolibacter cernigliae]ANX05151.1 hypothetical protein PG2T_13820 [Immundisolibacter cernigliae]